MPTDTLDDPFAEVAEALSDSLAILAEEFGLEGQIPDASTIADNLRGLASSSPWDEPDSDPHAEILAAAVEHVQNCAENGTDPEEGLARLHSLLPDATEKKAVAWDESKHPRGDDGRFIGREAIKAAMKDGKKAEALRAKVTDPAERKKLDAALSGEVHPSMLGSAKEVKEKTQASKDKARELSTKIMLRPKEATAEDYKALIPHLHALTGAELSTLRAKLGASFGGKRRVGERRAALLAFAEGKAEAFADEIRDWSKVPAGSLFSSHRQRAIEAAKQKEAAPPEPDAPPLATTDPTQAMRHEIEEYAKLGISPAECNSGECGEIAARVVTGMRAAGADASFGYPREGPAHVWVVANGKHYDAQHPEGVDDPSQLTFFKDNPDLLEQGWKRTHNRDPREAQADAAPESAAVPSAPDLTADEKAAAMSYKNAGHVRINRDLRSGAQLDATGTKLVENLDSAISKTRTTKPVTLHRGMGNRLLLEDNGLPENIKTGDTFTDPGYASTFEDLESARKWSPGPDDVTASVHVPVGVGALATDALAGHSSDEGETLLERGLTYRVLGVTPKSGGRGYHLELEVAKPSPSAPDSLPGGAADNLPDSAVPAPALAQGTAHEAEHTGDPATAKEIAKDHLAEDPQYYEKLQAVEKPPAEAAGGKQSRLDEASASKLQSGDVVRDDKGNEYVAHSVRQGVMRAYPIVNGKPQVDRDSMVTFMLDTNPVFVDAYSDAPGWTASPIYSTGKNAYAKTGQEEKPGKPQARTETHQFTRQEWIGSARGEEAKRAKTEHRTAVESALAAGKPVPPEVLADYPGLATTAPATSAQPAPKASAAKLQSRLKAQSTGNLITPQEADTLLADIQKSHTDAEIIAIANEVTGSKLKQPTPANRKRALANLRNDLTAAHRALESQKV